MIQSATLSSLPSFAGRGAPRQPAGEGFVLPGEDAGADGGATLLPDGETRQSAAAPGNALPVDPVAIDPWVMVATLAPAAPVVAAPSVPATLPPIVIDDRAQAEAGPALIASAAPQVAATPAPLASDDGAATAPAEPIVTVSTGADAPTLRAVGDPPVTAPPSRQPVPATMGRIAPAPARRSAREDDTLPAAAPLSDGKLPETSALPFDEAASTPAQRSPEPVAPVSIPTVSLATPVAQAPVVGTSAPGTEPAVRSAADTSRRPPGMGAMRAALPMAALGTASMGAIANATMSRSADTAATGDSGPSIAPGAVVASTVEAARLAPSTVGAEIAAVATLVDRTQAGASIGQRVDPAAATMMPARFAAPPLAATIPDLAAITSADLALASRGGDPDPTAITVFPPAPVAATAMATAATTGGEMRGPAPLVASAGSSSTILGSSLPSGWKLSATAVDKAQPRMSSPVAQPAPAMLAADPAAPAMPIVSPVAAQLPRPDTTAAAGPEPLPAAASSIAISTATVPGTTASGQPTAPVRSSTRAGDAADPRTSAPSLVPLPRADASPTPLAVPSAIAFGAARFAAQTGERADDRLPTLDAIGQVALTATAVPLAVAPSASAPLDVRHERWPTAMIERIEMIRDAAADAANAADTRIRLVPDALGPIDVAVQRDGDTLHVRFTSEQPQTRALLHDASPRLAEAAEARGLRLGQTSVGGSDAGAAGQQPQDQRSPARHAAAPPRAPVSPVASPALGDTDDTRLA